MIVTLRVNCNIETTLPDGPLNPDETALKMAAVEAVERALGFSETVGWEHRLAHETTIHIIDVAALFSTDIE